MNIKNVKRAVSVFLCVIFLLSGAGCQKSAPATEAEADAPAEGFSLSQMPLPEELALSTALFAGDSAIYIGGANPAGAAVFGRYAEDTFTEYALPGGTSFIYACCCADGAAMALVGDYPLFWTDVNGNRRINDASSKAMSLLVYDPDGGISREIAIQDARISEQNIRSLRFYNDSFYLLGQYCFAQLDLSGKVLNIIQTENSSFFAQELTDKGLAVCLFDAAADGGDNAAKLAHLDTTSFRFTDILIDAERIFYGLGCTAEGEYLVNADGTLLELDAAGNATELFSFSELGCAKSDFMGIYEFEGDYIAAARNLTYIPRITYGELTDTRQELKLLAVVNSAAITGLVERFNSSSAEYVVKIEYIGDMSQEQLNALIASGNGPDIFSMIGTELVDNVRHDAIFEDLCPYLQSDPDYTPETLIPALREALMEDGALYNLPIDFMLWTFCAQKDCLPSGDTDLTALLENSAEYSAPIFSSSISQADLWYWISNLYLNNHLDRQGKSVDFETGEFISLLECCAKVSAEQSISDDFGLLHLEQISSLLRLEYLHTRYGENYSLTGEVGNAFSVQQSLAISALSEHKDGAWQFVRGALSPSLPQSAELCLPAAQARFDALIAQGLNGSLWNLTKPVEITAYDAQELRNLADSTHVLLDAYPDIIQIMKEEAAKFFAGDRSADKTAEVIQGRANIVLAEKYG